MQRLQLGQVTALYNGDQLTVIIPEGMTSSAYKTWKRAYNVSTDADIISLFEARQPIAIEQESDLTNSYAVYLADDPSCNVQGIDRSQISLFREAMAEVTGCYVTSSTMLEFKSHVHHLLSQVGIEIETADDTDDTEILSLDSFVEA